MSIDFSNNGNVNYNNQIALEDQQTRGQENEDSFELLFEPVPRQESPESKNMDSVASVFSDILKSIGLTDEETKELLDFMKEPLLEDDTLTEPRRTTPREEVDEETVNLEDEETVNEDDSFNLDDFFDIDTEETEVTDETALTEEETVSDGVIGDFEQSTSKYMGDCWFLSAIVAVNDTSEGKQIIKDSITDNEDGTYSVTFAGDPSETFTITQDDLDNINSSGDIDVAILEEAARQYYEKNEDRDIGEGGMEEGISLLTGLNVDEHPADSDPEVLKDDLLKMAQDHAEGDGEGAIMMLATDTWMTAEGEIHENGDRGMGHMMAITDINEEENTISYVDPYDSKTIITQDLDKFAELQSSVVWSAQNIPAQIYSAPGEMKVHPKIQELANSIDQGEAESLLDELDLEQDSNGDTTNMALYNVMHNTGGSYTDEQRAAAFRILETK